jgi:hypothetical protein
LETRNRIPSGARGLETLRTVITDDKFEKKGKKSKKAIKLFAENYEKE